MKGMKGAKGKEKGGKGDGAAGKGVGAMWWQFPPLGNISYAGQAEQSDWTSQNGFQPICAVLKTSKEEHRFKPIYAVAKKPVKLNNMFDLLREPIDDIEDKDVNIVEDKLEDKSKEKTSTCIFKSVPNSDEKQYKMLRKQRRVHFEEPGRTAVGSLPCIVQTYEKQEEMLWKNLWFRKSCSMIKNSGQSEMQVVSPSVSRNSQLLHSASFKCDAIQEKHVFKSSSSSLQKTYEIEGITKTTKPKMPRMPKFSRKISLMKSDHLNIRCADNIRTGSCPMPLLRQNPGADQDPYEQEKRPKLLNVLTVQERVEAIKDAMRTERMIGSASACDTRCQACGPCWAVGSANNTDVASKTHKVLVPQKPVNALASQEQMESNGWQLLSIIIDSGAAETVIPHKQVQGYKIQETSDSKAGLCYASATGDPIPNMGEQILPLGTAEGTWRSMRFQAAPVERPLGSVMRICEAGHRVVFDAEEGIYILNKKT